MKTVYVCRNPEAYKVLNESKMEASSCKFFNGINREKNTSASMIPTNTTSLSVYKCEDLLSDSKRANINTVVLVDNRCGQNLQFDDPKVLAKQLVDNTFPERNQINLILLTSDFATRGYPRLRKFATLLHQAITSLRPEFSITLLTPIDLSRGDKQTRVSFSSQNCKVEGVDFDDQVTTIYEGSITALIENKQGQLKSVNTEDRSSSLRRSY